MTGPNTEVSHCLCGSVKITLSTFNPKFSVCHCDTCRTWAGGPLFSLQCGSHVEFEGSDLIKRYDSSPWASRGFCANCGTHLFYQLKKTGDYSISLGLFPNLGGLTMDMQYFSDSRPDYYCFTNQSKEMTTAEIAAYFSSHI